MTEQVSHAVEAIKLAYLSHTPVVWLVTGDKEVASEIVEQFTIEHFGAFRNPNILGRPVFLQQFTENAVERLSVDETLKYYWDRPLKDFIGRSNIKEFSSSSSDAANKPSVFYLWHTDNSDNVMKHIESFITVHVNMIADADVQSKTPEHQKAVSLSLAIVASPTLPPESWLAQYIEVIHVKALQDSEIREIIHSTLSSRGIVLNDDEALRKLVADLRGFSARKMSQTILRCVLSGFFDNNKTMLPEILREIRYMKRQMLEGFVGLQWIDLGYDKDQETTKQEQSKASDSLAVISEWLDARKEIFKDTEKARKSGYDIPKGVLITGIPGTGKSMMAKEAAKKLELPLISLDMGNLQEGIVGASEKHMVDALRMVEAMAPCVLWIDEIEKAFSGSNSGSSDGGVMRRMFGKFLTWMQEKTAPCFVFATSNDISQLPPELFRSERFDDKFYSFMPMADECASIFAQLISEENKRFVSQNFYTDLQLFEPTLEDWKIWREFLDDMTVKMSHFEMDGDEWKNGEMPQCKLFTGADISSLIKRVKFKLLHTIKKDVKCSFNSETVFNEIRGELEQFMPYGQTNVEDIAKCFLKISKNRFCCASNNTIVQFEDFNIVTKRLQYEHNKYTGAYDRALYATIVGAVNSLSKKDRNSYYENR